MNYQRRLLHVGLVVAGLCVAATLGATTRLPRAGNSLTANREAEAAIRNFLSPSAIAHQYTASRHLEASGAGRRAWLDVHTNFSGASGLLYEVTGEGGSGYIRSRVLRSLLDEERRLIASRGEPAVALTTANYEFVPEGLDGEGLAVVMMRPLRKDKALIDGRLFMTLDGELRRVEGRLAKTPSFWVTRVDVVRSYRRINGIVMPVSLDTKAQLRLFGKSDLRMTYQYSHIDEQPVDAANHPE